MLKILAAEVEVASTKRSFVILPECTPFSQITAILEEDDEVALKQQGKVPSEGLSLSTIPSEFSHNLTHKG